MAEARLREWAPREPRETAADLLAEHQYYLAPLLPPATFLADPSTAPESLLRIDASRTSPRSIQRAGQKTWTVLLGHQAATTPTVRFRRIFFVSSTFTHLGESVQSAVKLVHGIRIQTTSQRRSKKPSHALRAVPAPSGS